MKKKLKNTSIIISGVIIALTLFINSSPEINVNTMINGPLNNIAASDAGEEVDTEKGANPDFSGISYKIIVRNLPYLNNK